MVRRIVELSNPGLMSSFKRANDSIQLFGDDRYFAIMARRNNRWVWVIHLDAILYHVTVLQMFRGRQKIGMSAFSQTRCVEWPFNKISSGLIDCLHLYFASTAGKEEICTFFTDRLGVKCAFFA